MFTLKLRGSPRERGEAHGAQYSQQIRELAEIRKGLICGFLKEYTPVEIETLARQQIVVLKEKYPDFYAEFLGISQASGVSESDLMILNNYTDMRDFSKTPDSRDEGCSAVSVRSEKAALCGQTWDMHASATPYILHLDVRGFQGTPDSHVLTVTGCLGLAGVNAHGLAVLINNMHCHETKVGLMWPGLVRGMLEQKSSADAHQYLEKNIPCSGHNYLLCDARESINVETTGLRAQVTHRDQGKGVLFHTNHYVGDLAKYERLDRQSASTHNRYKALESYFNSRSTDSIGVTEVVRDIFSGQVTESVCIADPRPRDPHGSMTCGGVIFDLKSRKGQCFSGIYGQGKVLDFSV